MGLADRLTAVSRGSGARRHREPETDRNSLASNRFSSTPRGGSTLTLATVAPTRSERGRPPRPRLRAVLDVADDIIVPMETEPLSFDPTARTINKVIKPRGLPYKVVINNWDPRTA